MTSPLASASGLPHSAVMICARSSALSRISRFQACSNWARRRAVKARQAGQAALAASMACRVSAAPQSGTSPIVSPLAGLMTAKVVPFSASFQFWPIFPVDRSRSGFFNFMVLKIPVKTVSYDLFQENTVA